MGLKNIEHDFLFSKDCGFINGDDGDCYKYSDGSGYYHGDDGSEGYIYSDGSGYYHGADGTDGYIYSDGSAYYHGADGSDGYKYADGSGYFHGADGSEANRYADGSGSVTTRDGDTNYISSEDDETDDDTEDSISKLGEALGTLVGAGIVGMFAGGVAKAREERMRQDAYEEEMTEIIHEEERARAQKRRDIHNRHKKLFRFLYSIIFVAVVVVIGYYEYEQLIPIGYEATDFIGEDYQDVRYAISRAGFRYISVNEIEDLRLTDISQENIVTDIRIGWLHHFSAEWKLPSNFPIKISYHVLEKIAVPFSAKDAKGQNSDDIIKALKATGFINIEQQVDYDVITGWIAKEKEVKSVMIDGNDKFSEGSKFRLQIAITSWTPRGKNLGHGWSRRIYP